MSRPSYRASLGCIDQVTAFITTEQIRDEITHDQLKNDLVAYLNFDFNLIVVIAIIFYV